MLSGICTAILHLGSESKISYDIANATVYGLALGLWHSHKFTGLISDCDHPLNGLHYLLLTLEKSVVRWSFSTLLHLIRSTTWCFYCDSKIVWYQWQCNQLVCVIARWPYPLHSLWRFEVNPCSSVLWGLTRTGPWADPIFPIHGQSVAAGRVPWVVCTFVCWSNTDLRLLPPGWYCSAPKHGVCVSTKLHCGCGRIDCTLMLTSPRFSVSSACWQHQIPDEPLLVRWDTVTKSSVCVRSRHLCWLRPIDVN